MKFILRFLLLFFSLTVILSANNIIDIDKKVKQAQKEKKAIMFFFHIPRCPYCKSMIDENFHDKTILALIKENFILVDIYTANTKNVVLKRFKGSSKKFAQHIGATAYPATLFMDSNGKVFYKAIGYRNIHEYINEIKYITTNSYKKMELDEFIIKMEIEND
ncbi:MAG: hypothetical protein DRG78_09540 [Epsilonproteobacteria bacterium]|nr:MAG: hypothetical protein DRG78_09540 [Campylobacterota bacterium]